MQIACACMLDNCSMNREQSKLASFAEANANTAIGFIVSTLTWRYIVPLIFPQLEPHAGWSTAIWITLLFTFMSIGRNYIVRRLFNYWGAK